MFWRLWLRLLGALITFVKVYYNVLDQTGLIDSILCV